MTGFEIEVSGLDQMIGKLNAKIRRLEQSILRKALQAFAEPIRRAAEAHARTLISPRLKLVSQIRLRGSGGTVRIGPSTDIFETSPTGRQVSHANIGYWFEFGYNIRAVRKGPSLAFVGARPFLTPAYESQKAAALAAFEEVMRNALEEEIAA